MNGDTVVVAANRRHEAILVRVKIDIHPYAWRQVASHAIRPDGFWNFWLLLAIGGFVTLGARFRSGVLFPWFVRFVWIVAGGASQ